MNKLICVTSLAICFLSIASCSQDDSNNRAREEYTESIIELESQIGQLNTVIEELAISNEQLKEDAIEEFDKTRTIDLVRLEAVYGSITINSNAKIMSSPFDDADILFQIESELPAYCEYTIRNSSDQRWLLVRVADTSLGFVRETDVLDVEDKIDDYSGRIEADGIKQNTSIYEVINKLGDNFVNERRESYALIYSINTNDDLVLTYNIDTSLISGFSIRSDCLSLDSGFAVNDDFNSVIDYYKGEYVYQNDGDTYTFQISTNEYLELIGSEDESGKLRLDIINITPYNYDSDFTETEE